MTRQRYGRWAAGVGDQDLGRALGAAGLAAAHRSANASAEAPTTEADVLGRLSDADPAAALPWRDPTLDPAWGTPAMESAASWAAIWAEIFGTLQWPVRCAMEIAPGSNPRWLTTMFAKHGVFTSAFVRLESADTTVPWRFPLRLGFLDRPEPRAVRELLVHGFTNSSWRSTLIEPLTLGRERVVCDILLLTDPARASLKSVTSLREVRAGAVMVTRQLHRWDGGLVAQLIRKTGAWAVGFCDISDPADWLVRLTEELSHNLTLDLAFGFSTNSRGVLAARPEQVRAGPVARRAEAVADSLRHIDSDLVRILAERPPPRGAKKHTGWPREYAYDGPQLLGVDAAYDFERIAATGAFRSEAGEASELARMEYRSIPLIERRAANRWLQARIATAKRPDLSLPRFQVASQHRVDVRIAKHDREGWLAAETPFPEDRLPARGPQRLTIVLTEPHLLRRPAVKEVVLPMLGSSTVATFRLTTRLDTEVVDARIIVLSRNRVLQTARLPQEVAGPDDEAEPPNAPVAEPETFVAAATGWLDERRTFDASFLVNKNLDGAPRITSIAGTRAGIVRIDDRTLTAAVGKISKRLAEIVETPEDFERIDSAGSVELLVFLANHGALMRRALVRNSLGLDQVLRSSRYLQVVSAQPEAYFPFELAYDFVAPTEDAALCPAAPGALASDDIDSGCPAEHTRDVVCPLGFWGLTRIIERHAYQPGADVTGAFMIRGQPARGRDRLPLGPVVLAASDRVDGFAPGSVDAVAAALAVAGSNRRIAVWEDWAGAIADEKPALLLLLPHTVYSDTLDLYGLEIGTDARRWASEIDEAFVPSEDRPVIVALLGCDTACAGDVSYETFPGLLRLAGAEIVIATLTEVLGRHAAPLAIRLVDELYRHSVDEPHGMGEAMVRLRRRLLADGVAAVLAVTAFGDADWLITNPAP